MNCFIDTSALYAVIDADDTHFPKAKKQWKELIQDNSNLITSNYILLESIALIQNRLGINALRTFQEDITPILTIEWVTEESHRSSIMSLLSSTKTKVSLVDYVSFEIMRRLGLKTVFAFDRHFKEQGFTCIP